MPVSRPPKLPPLNHRPDRAPVSNGGRSGGAITKTPAASEARAGAARELEQPIVIHKKHDGTLELLDGKNRLDAMEMVGIEFMFTKTKRRAPGYAFELIIGDECIGCSVGDSVVRLEHELSDAQIADLVVALNVHRRHLTVEQKRDAVAKLIKADPTRSNRQIAAEAKASHPHVAKVRSELEKAGDVETVTTSIDTKGRKQPARKAKTVVDAAQVERDRAECIALNNKCIEAETKFKTHVAAYDAARAEIKEIRAGQKIITAEQRKAEHAADEDEEKEPAENHRTVFFLRAEQAQKLAVSSCEVDEEMASTARAVAASWSRLADNAETADDGEYTDKDKKKTFLLMAASAIESAQTLDKHFNAKPNADVIHAARYAADEWTNLAEKLGPEDEHSDVEDPTGCFIALTKNASEKAAIASRILRHVDQQEPLIEAVDQLIEKWELVKRKIRRLKAAA